MRAILEPERQIDFVPDKQIGPEGPFAANALVVGRALMGKRDLEEQTVQPHIIQIMSTKDINEEGIRKHLQHLRSFTVPRSDLGATRDRPSADMIQLDDSFYIDGVHSDFVQLAEEHKKQLHNKMMAQMLTLERHRDESLPDATINFEFDPRDGSVKRVLTTQRAEQQQRYQTLEGTSQDINTQRFYNTSAEVLPSFPKWTDVDWRTRGYDSESTVVKTNRLHWSVL